MSSFEILHILAVFHCHSELNSISYHNYVPTPWAVGAGGLGGHIVFSTDPFGGVATCLHCISLLNGQILAKLTQIYH